MAIIFAAFFAVSQTLRGRRRFADTSPLDRGEITSQVLTSLLRIEAPE